jgi:hypothetical protein
MYHYNKYIKYKNKYIGLKNIIGGTSKKIFDTLIDLLAECYKEQGLDLLDPLNLPPQTDAHTEITETWEQVSDPLEVLDAKSNIKGSILKVKEPIKISSYHLDFNEDLIDRIKNKEIIIKFNFSDNYQSIFPNFWEVHTKEETLNTNYIYKPVVGKPYAYHSDTYKEPGDFYRIIARAFTTKVSDLRSPHMPIETFNKKVDTYDFTKASIPIRIKY